MTTLILCYYAFCAQPGEDLDVLDDKEVAALQEKGVLPCVGIPSQDFEGSNQMTCMYVAEYENGYELTLLFLDEDRPNACADCCLDFIRRPLFGRYFDVETVFLMKESDGRFKVEFPGTYSGDQKWNVFNPAHAIESIDLTKFEKKSKRVGDGQAQDRPEQDGLAVLYVNTWNHLMAERNNNTEMDMTFMFPLPGKKPEAGADPSVHNTNQEDPNSFVVRRGSRKDVEGRFKGCMSSVTTVMTEERETKLGKRIDVDEGEAEEQAKN